MAHSLPHERDRNLSLHLVCHRFVDKTFGNLRRTYLGQRNIPRPHSAIVNDARTAGVLDRQEGWSTYWRQVSKEPAEMEDLYLTIKTMIVCTPSWSSLESKNVAVLEDFKSLCTA